MSTEAVTELKSVTEQKLQLAADAVEYVLGRIRDDENIRYHMGASEAFERLKTAESAFTGVPAEAIQEKILNHPLKRIPAAKQLDTIKDIVHEYSAKPHSQAFEVVNKIAAALGW